MARRSREEIGQPEEPDLSPFMNVVVVLIPMLLLSVVFLEVAVINVTMPVGGSATTDESEEEEHKLDLAIAMAPSGFYVTAAGAPRPAMDGCPTQGPTICLKDTTVDTEALFGEARQLMAADGDASAGEEVLEEALMAYNYRELYNMLSEFKNDFPEETTARISADSDMPFALTVRVMDVIRYRLEEDSYTSDEDFWTAAYRTEPGEDGEEQFANLFGDPAFAVVQ